MLITSTFTRVQIQSNLGTTIWPTKFAKYDSYNLFGVCLVEKHWIVL